MIFKNCGASLPFPGKFSEDDNILLDRLGGLLEGVRTAMEQQLCHRALEDIWMLVRAANSYVDHQAPWSLKKSDPERMSTVLYVLAESLRQIGILIQPFMPNSSDKLLEQLGVPDDERKFSHLSKSSCLVPGRAISQPKGIFPRIPDDTHFEK